MSEPLSGLELRKAVAEKLGAKPLPYNEHDGVIMLSDGSLCPPFELSLDACEEFMKIVRKAGIESRAEFVDCVIDAMENESLPGFIFWLHATPADLSNAYLIWREQG